MTATSTLTQEPWHATTAFASSSKARLTVSLIIDVRRFAPLVGGRTEAGRHHAGRVVVRMAAGHEFGPIVCGAAGPRDARPDPLPRRDTTVALRP